MIKFGVFKVIFLHFFVEIEKNSILVLIIQYEIILTS